MPRQGQLVAQRLGGQALDDGAFGGETLVLADAGDGADLEQIEQVQLGQEGQGDVRRCFGVADQGNLDRVCLQQTFAPVDRAENLHRQPVPVKQRQQVMFVNGRITQGRQQHLGGLLLHDLKELFLAGNQGLPDLV